jgi:two-component system response regulator RegX3
VSAKILVVDDDEDLGESLCEAVQAEGFVARLAVSGEAALTVARSWRPHVVLLDLMLPDIDGLSVCRALHKEGQTAIIMVTGRSAEVDRVVGLEIGADDYLVKPFSTRELIARVRAVLRRTGDSDPFQSALVSGNLELQRDAHKVFLRDRPVDLTLKEFGLLRTLMTHRGRALSRDYLYETVWGGAPAVDSRTLDAHIRSLREKIEKDLAKPSRIVTVRGVGYRFEG